MTTPDGVNNSPTLVQLQTAVRTMVKEQGFVDETPKDILLLFLEEAGELARAVRKITGLKMASDTRRAELSEEVADCLIYLLDLANHFDLDVGSGVKNKLEKVSKRVWE